MNFICLYINFLNILICIICQEDLLPKSIQLEQLYFLENEKLHLEQNFLPIPFENNEDLQTKLSNFSTKKLLEKYTNIDLGLEDDVKLFQFLRHYGKYFDICFLQYQQIDCKIRINNTLYNEGLIIDEITPYSIYLPSNSCQNLFYIEEDSFLIICKNYQNNSIQYFLLNEQNQILDEFTFDQPQNCKLDSKFLSNKIFINSMSCQLSLIFIIEINLFEGRLQFFEKNYTKLHELEGYPKNYNLIDLKLCEQDVVLLIFEQILCTYNLKDHQLTIQITLYEPWFVYIQDSCFPYVKRGLLQAKNTQGFYYPLFNQMINEESQLKRILQFEKIFIFYYEDYSIITNEIFQQEKVFNVKQINKLNSLPFLMILDQNNKISIYSMIISLNKFIEYQNVPYIGIFQKSQLILFETQMLFYYKISKYIINYPLRVEMNESILIDNKERDINTYILDLKQLSQSIPFFLEYKQDQDDVQLECNSEMYFIHHRNLSYKQILKIMSFEINFIVIIYRDMHNNIYAYLKNNEISKNVFIMKTTQEVSIEFFEIDINNIRLFFITHNKIMIVQIVAKKDFVFYDSFLPKSDIKQYKINMLIITFLLNDNTVIAYQYHNWFEYFSTKNKQLKDYWMNMDQDQKYNDFRVPYLYIDHQNNTIEIQPIRPNSNKILVTVHDQILLSYIFVPSSRILLIVRKNNSISLNLYYFDLNEIFLLYQMPIYDFIIQEPIQIKFNENLFSIITIKNGQEYLFTYNITQQGKTCLRFITKMQKSYQNFELIHSTGIISQELKDTIVIQYPYLNLRIKSTKISDNSRIPIEIKFSVKSYIQSYPSDFMINLDLFNYQNTLRYQLNSKKSILIVDKNNELINLDDIYGNINNIQLSQTCNGLLIKPIQLIQTIQLNNCSSIYQQFCYISESEMIIDYFHSNITITVSSDRKLINSQSQFNQKVIILYSSIYSSIGFFNLSEIQSIQKNIDNIQNYIKLENFEYYNSCKLVKVIENCIFLDTSSFYFIYQLNKDLNYQSYKQECSVEYTIRKQIEFLLWYQSQFILLTLNSLSQIFIEICPYRQNPYEPAQKFEADFQIVAFHILSQRFENYKIYLIVILFCHTDKGYIYEFNFDVQKSIITKSSMKSLIIRYIDIYYEDFNQISETNFILKGKYKNQIQSSYFYKINLNLSNEVIDYYYQDQEFTDIKQYNETHYAQIRGENKTVELIQINNYQLYLQKNNCEIIIYNDVSILRSPIILEYQIENKSNITLILLIGNFILILFKSNKRRRL